MLHSFNPIKYKLFKFLIETSNYGDASCKAFSIIVINLFMKPANVKWLELLVTYKTPILAILEIV